MLKLRWLVIIGSGLLSFACRPLDMYDQGKYEPGEVSEFYDDQKANRHPPANTIPWPKSPGLRNDNHAQLNYQAAEVPYALTIRDLQRGRERYDIFCAPCHGLAGYGDGMIVQRGYNQPPSFHTKRLNQLPIGHYVFVIEQGLGAMPSYKKAVSQRDRWLITAYIKALQISQKAKLKDLPTHIQKQAEEAL